MHSKFQPQTKREFIFLILILGSVTAIGPLTIDIYLPAFSEIARGFSASESLVQLSLTTYFIGIALGQILYGPVIDRFGKKPPLFFGLFLFVIASIGCYFCKNIEQLITLRFFQALGACAGTVVPRAIIRDIFHPQDAGKAFSHLMLVMGVAPILAPLAGNIILEQFGWKMIFAFLGFFGVLCLVITTLAIPETKGFNKDEKISHAFKKYFGILHDRSFVAGALSGGLVMAGLFAYITGSPFIYLDFFGLSSREYGIIFSINSIGFIAASQINARLLRKFSIEILLKKILFLQLFCGIILIVSGVNEPGFWLLTLLFFIFLFCCGAIVPNTTALALANQSIHSGSASALLGTLQFLFATITSFLISKLHNGGAIPITLIVGSCAIFSWAIFYNFHKHRET